MKVKSQEVQHFCSLKFSYAMWKPAISEVRYLNILTWLRAFQVKIDFFYPSIPKRDLDTKKIPPGAHHWEPATIPYSCHGVFTDRSIFSLNLLRVLIPTGTSVTNCNHKLGLMLMCWHNVDMFTWDRIVLSLPKHAYVDRNWSISLVLVCKNAVAVAYYGSCRLLVMGSWHHQI